MSNTTGIVEIVVLGAILLFALYYLWGYIKRALGSGNTSACSNCSQGDSCSSAERVGRE